MTLLRIVPKLIDFRRESNVFFPLGESIRLLSDTIDLFHPCCIEDDELYYTESIILSLLET